MSGEDLLDLKPLETFHLELNVVAGEEVREESLLVNDPHQCPIEVEGVIGLALPADYPEISLVETLEVHIGVIELESETLSWEVDSVDYDHRDGILSDLDRVVDT